MSRYFSYISDPLLSCPCCGDRGMVTAFLEKLDLMREEYGRPIRISSGYRCAHYNSKVSSTGIDGPHTTGRAVDIPCRGEDAHELLGLAFKHGFTGIGVSQKGSKRFIHLDNLNHNLRPWLWSY